MQKEEKDNTENNNNNNTVSSSSTGLKKDESSPSSSEGTNRLAKILGYGAVGAGGGAAAGAAVGAGVGAGVGAWCLGIGAGPGAAAGAGIGAVCGLVVGGGAGCVVGNMAHNTKMKSKAINALKEQVRLAHEETKRLHEEHLREMQKHIEDIERLTNQFKEMKALQEQQFKEMMQMRMSPCVAPSTTSSTDVVVSAPAPHQSPAPLHNENQNDPIIVTRGGESHQCALCLDNPTDTILMPCKHAVCEACSSFATCAFCNSEVQSRMRVFLP